MATEPEEEFVGHLTTFDRKSEEDREDCNVMLEVTQVTAGGWVEIAFDDRNERVYLSLNLSDLARHVCRLAGSKD